MKAVIAKFILLSVALLGIAGSPGRGAEASRFLDLPASAIFARGPNQWDHDVLEITKGRGANLGWYVKAYREEDVTVWIEYSCAHPLNQEYLLSFDG